MRSSFQYTAVPAAVAPASSAARRCGDEMLEQLDNGYVMLEENALDQVVPSMHDSANVPVCVQTTLMRIDTTRWWLVVAACGDAAA